MAILEQKIAEILNQKPSYGRVLHNFGISFFNYEELTLKEVCLQKGLKPLQLIKEMEAYGRDAIQEEHLEKYPIELVLQYLKHNHFVFIHEQLPYMAHLIENLDPQLIGNPGLVQDLQILFPLFVEDFIGHIHEEEDRLFSYINLLHQAQQGKYNISQLYQAMEDKSIRFFALDHHTHDDEMRGIREITQNYTLDPRASLHQRVLYAELQSLEHDLCQHAKIEDNILFFKALALEEEIKGMIREKVRFN